MLCLLLATFLSLTLSCSGTKDFNVTTREVLHKQLLKSYDKDVIPSAAGKPVIVQMGATITHFDMHERDHTLSVDIRLHLEWNDLRLKWNDTEYGGLQQLSFEATKLWTPDLTLYSTTQWRNSDLMSANKRIVLMNNGDVVYIPPANIKVLCFMDVTLWPYDRHKCKAKFGSWVHDSMGYDISVTDLGLQVDLSVDDKMENRTHGEWNLADASLTKSVMKYLCCEEVFVDAVLHMSLYRNAPAYCWTVMMPVAVLWILTFVTFLLPPASGEKILVASLLLLANILFLDYTSKMIGHSPTHTPILVKLLCLQLVMLVLAVLISAIVLNISRSPHTLALPSSLKLQLLRLSTVLGLASYSHRMTRSNGADLEKSDRLELGDESKLCSGELQRACRCYSQESHWSWLLLGAVIDRLFLVIYLIVFFLSICIFGSSV